MNYKKAALGLAADLRAVAKGSAAFVAVGAFFGGDWSLVAAVAVFSVIELAAFFVEAWADNTP